MTHPRPPVVADEVAPLRHFEPDAWLARVLERPAYHLRVSDIVAVAEDALDEDLRMVDSLGAFVDAKVPTADVSIVSALESRGFRTIDTNVRLAAPGRAAVGESDSGIRFRPASAYDEEAVVGLAATAFVWSRFHLDPLIPETTAARVKGEWARNYFNGERGDSLIVAEEEDAVVGFNLLLKNEDDVVVDLIAVSADHRRHGVGRRLVELAAHAAGEVGRVVVGTQVANVASMRLYESLGFRCESSAYVLHRHGS